VNCIAGRDRFNQKMKIESRTMRWAEAEPGEAKSAPDHLERLIIPRTEPENVCGRGKGEEACEINFIRRRLRSRISFGSRKSSPNKPSQRRRMMIAIEPPSGYSVDEFINDIY
jgi:hypothetical protein